ncbi:hypothetical protein BDZ45DRAFT_801368 [Acephala macrosclerotiorum]|nr:hypothetical protein BDZ45DRAFT_801368 [Acephala macrosclerotiorum]
MIFADCNNSTTSPNSNNSKRKTMSPDQIITLTVGIRQITAALLTIRLNYLFYRAIAANRRSRDFQLGAITGGS